MRAVQQLTGNRQCIPQWPFHPCSASRPSNAACHALIHTKGSCPLSHITRAYEVIAMCGWQVPPTCNRHLPLCSPLLSSCPLRQSAARRHPPPCSPSPLTSPPRRTPRSPSRAPSPPSPSRSRASLRETAPSQCSWPLPQRRRSSRPGGRRQEAGPWVGAVGFLKRHAALWLAELTREWRSRARNHKGF